MLGTSLSASDCANLRRAVALSGRRWLQFDPDEIRSGYNRRPFLVNHQLQGHPDFQLPQLFKLCRRMPSQVSFRFGVIPKDADFDAAVPKYRGNLTLDDAIDHLEEKQAYIIVYNPELDPEYRPVIESLMGEVADHIAPVDPVMTWYSTYFFISAHDSLTPYHMDREMNFLLQIRGLKTVRLWDPFDDEVMTAEQKDRLLSITGEASRPTYHEKLESRAKVFELRPGLGVHQPFIAPHLISTGPEISVSFAMTFRTQQSDSWAAAHRLNHQLRGLGLNPRPVGQDAALDRNKARIIAGLRRARALIGKS